MHPLRVSDNGRLILRSDGPPFFWLADTAWELVHRLTRDEIDHYLQTRARQQFTVIQAVVLAECDGLGTPNREGELPLFDLDPDKPNEKYLKLVDFTVDRAAELGLTMGLLPTWGDKVNPAHAKGPAIFSVDNARRFGALLAKRYRGKPIFWINGGDRHVRDDNDLFIWRAMAEGIRSVAGREQLITFHPAGGATSSTAVHHEAWLNMNMLQSGHTGRDNPNWTMVRNDRALEPAKPVLDGEPNYEDHPVMSSPPSGRWMGIPGQYFDEYDVRKAAYRSLLSGACGHTYGCHGMWQFYGATEKPPINGPRLKWHEALALPGAEQMRHARALFESLPWEKLIPNQKILAKQGAEPATYTVAMTATDLSLALVYTPGSHSLPLNLDRFGTMQATWFNPRTGERTPAQTITGRCSIDTPDRLDWLLILERR